MLISYESVFERLGTDDERNTDRKFLYMYGIGEYRRKRREALTANDYERLDDIERSYVWLDCL